MPPMNLNVTNNTEPPESILLAKSDDNLIWLDCEMSGLDPEKERL